MARGGEKKEWDLEKAVDRARRFITREIRACPEKYRVHLARVFRLIAKQLEQAKEEE